MHEWTCMILWKIWLDFEWFSWGTLVFGCLSFEPLRFCISSHGWWNLVIFVLNGRALRVLCFGIFCGIYRGLCWDWLRFPHWAILKSSCFGFSEGVWFGMPIYFGMLFLPRFRDTGLFRYADRLSDFELRAWIQSTGIFRCAEISWFGRPEEICVPIQDLRMDWGPDSVDRINSVCQIRPLSQNESFFFSEGFDFYIAKQCKGFVMFLAMLKWFENGFSGKVRNVLEMVFRGFCYVLERVRGERVPKVIRS